MKRIEQYGPPSPENLARLKDDLGFTSPQMADLAGLAKGSQWRKYTGRTEHRTMGQHMHFYMAALLTLDEEELMRIAETMRTHGAVVELGSIPFNLSRVSAES